MRALAYALALLVAVPPSLAYTQDAGPRRAERPRASRDAGPRARRDAGPRRRARRDAGPRRRARRDAGPPPTPDAGPVERVDAGVPTTVFDSGPVDATPATEVLDAGAPVDAGAPTDAGAESELTETYDAGPPVDDAGPVSAEGPESAEPITATSESAGDPDRPYLEALQRWFYERDVREAERRAAAARRAAREQRDTPSAASPTILEAIGLTLPERRIATFPLLLLFLLTLLGVAVVQRTRYQLPVRGALPRLLALVSFALRVTALLLFLSLVARMLPAWLRPALLVALAAGAVAVGWSLWLLVPDLTGSLLLLMEGRVRRGLWVSVDGYEGEVERMGARSTVLRLPDQSRVTLPNRRLVDRATRVRPPGWPKVVVEVEAPDGHDATRVRAALRDAVLTSPYIPAEPDLHLAQRPDSSHRWTVTVGLLHLEYAGDFEGQLRERLEEALVEPEDDDG